MYFYHRSLFSVRRPCIYCVQIPRQPALLITCQLLSLITFGINLAFTPYWHQYIELAFSYIFILILIPHYFGTLVRRLSQIRDELINQILDLEKMEQGGLELKFLPLLSLDDFLNKRAEQFQAMAAKKSLTLTVELVTQLKAGEFYADPDNLDKVIFNLLSNAFKFTEIGGIVLSAQVKDNKAAITIRDSGMGIREDQLPFIFDRFRQATGSESKDYAGIWQMRWEKLCETAKQSNLPEPTFEQVDPPALISSMIKKP